MKVEDRQRDTAQSPSTGDSTLHDTQPLPQLRGEQRPETAPATEPTSAPEQGQPPTDQQGVSGQDAIVTPLPFALPPEDVNVEPSRRPSSRALWIAVGLCLFISLTSLALNGILIYSLLDARQTAIEGLDAAIAALDSFGGNGFHYEYNFEREIPITTDVPIQQDLIFPFEGDFPINTTVEVPIDAGVLGTFLIEVPIDTSIYVNTTVPIHVDQAFHISTTIPVSMTVPIDVQPDDPAVQDLIGEVREWLIRLRQSF